MKVRVIEDAQVLIPNPEHENFTETNQIIISGEEITGEPKYIQGKRKGEPFVYRLFLTNNNQLIYLNKTKNMDNTSGADSSVTPTVVNLKQTVLAKPGIIGAVSGAIIAFGYAKYKKHDTKKLWLQVGIGAVAGFVIGKVIAHTASVKPSK